MMSGNRDKQGKGYQTEQDDYYYDKNGNMVFTEKYHLKRGYCCKSGCRHCPYGYKRS
jgi:hypothetical protein